MMELDTSLLILDDDYLIVWTFCYDVHAVCCYTYRKRVPLQLALCLHTHNPMIPKT